jgi:hypothetical protein
VVLEGTLFEAEKNRMLEVQMTPFGRASTCDGTTYLPA